MENYGELLLDIYSKLYTYMDLSTAAADDLDRIGDMWGLKRGVTETDKEFQHRIRIFALGDTDIGAPFEFNEIPESKSDVGPQMKPIQARKCECGAATLGHTQTGQAHSSWCPLR